MLQQSFDHCQSGIKVGIDTDQPLPYLFGWNLVDEAKDGKNHGDTKEDEAETTH